jgi:hypothetical protein
MTDQAINQATSRTQTRSSDFLVVAAFSAIGLLVMLNVILRFPDLGTVIAQFNQF